MVYGCLASACPLTCIYDERAERKPLGQLYSLTKTIQEWMAATGGSCRVSSFLQIEFEQEAAAPHVKCEITRAVVSFCAPAAAAPQPLPPPWKPPLWKPPPWNHDRETRD
jgi:hypothetical protein